MPITAPEGYLDISNATLRGSEIITTSNVGIMNANPTMALSVGSNLHVNAYSSNVLEVNGNVVAEGLKLGFIEILPSYDLAAVSNVGNVTDSTIQFSNATTAFVTTSNIEVGTANLFVDTTTGRVGVGTTNPSTNLHVEGSALITGLTYAIKSIGTLGSDRTEDWYRLLVGGNRFGYNAIRTKCKLQLEATGLHQTVTFDFNHIISLSQTSGNSFNLLGNDHYISRAGIIKLRLADIGSDQVALDMYINHDVVALDRDWTITLYTEGGSLISEASTFLEKITATPTTSIEIDTDKSIFGIVGNQTSRSLVMSEDGNVGIGTASPTKTIDLGDSGGDIRMGHDHDTTIGTVTNSIGRAAPGGTWVASVNFINENTNDDAISFTTHEAGVFSGERMRISAKGRVGIGVANPLYPLDVSGNSTSGPPSGVWGYYVATGEVTNVGSPYDTYDQYISMRASENIIAQKFQTYSDRRIKKNIIEIDDNEALTKLRNLQPCKYNYIDNVKGGSRDVYGFIAQEVGSILPDAVGTHTSCIPNIYELANVSDSNVITFTNFDTSTLESNATVLKVYDTHNKEHLVNITEVVDDHNVRVDEDLSEWTGYVDETGNVVAGNQLFVYGQEVDDFFYLDKNAIWTVATAALQDVDRQLQAEKARNDALEARIAALENP